MSQKRQVPPELPEAPQYSGDRLVDNVWDLRAHVAALRQDIRGVDPAKVNQSAANGAANAVERQLSDRIETIKSLTHDLRQSAESLNAAESNHYFSVRVVTWLWLLLALIAYILGLYSGDILVGVSDIVDSISAKRCNSQVYITKEEGRPYCWLD